MLQYWVGGVVLCGECKVFQITNVQEMWQQFSGGDGFESSILISTASEATAVWFFWMVNSDSNSSSSSEWQWI